MSNKNKNIIIITHGKINAPVSKHIEMRTRLKWTVSYKSLYFVHLNLELVPSFTGMRERSINEKYPESHLIPL